MTTNVKERLLVHWIALSTEWESWKRQVRWCLPLILAACVFDGATTVRFMMEYGPSLESHPGIRVVSLWFGPLAGPVIGKLCQITAFVLFSKLWPKCTWPLAMLMILGAIAAGWHNLSL